MAEAILELIHLLEQQEALIKRLIALGREQTRALREDDLNALQRLMEEQEGLSQKLHSLERERMALVEKLAPELSAAGSTTIKNLLAQEGPHRERLATLAARLHASYVELKELNEINRRLIQQTLAYVNRVLAAWRSQETIYDRSGRLEGVGESANVDRVV